jgi:hypothetical protein
VRKNRLRTDNAAEQRKARNEREELKEFALHGLGASDCGLLKARFFSTMPDASRHSLSESSALYRL